MLMRGNALVLKTPVENAPRTSIEKHLSWSPDIPPAVRFPLHRSRPAGYQPNRQPATVGAESRAGEAHTVRARAEGGQHAKRERTYQRFALRIYAVSRQVLHCMLVLDHTMNDSPVV